MTKPGTEMPVEILPKTCNILILISPFTFKVKKAACNCRAATSPGRCSGNASLPCPASFKGSGSYDLPRAHVYPSPKSTEQWGCLCGHPTGAQSRPTTCTNFNRHRASLLLYKQCLIMFVRGYKMADSVLCPSGLHHQGWAVSMLAYLLVSGTP